VAVAELDFCHSERSEESDPYLKVQQPDFSPLCGARNDSLFGLCNRLRNLATAQTDQNFIGVKLGDVNNNWNAGIP